MGGKGGRTVPAASPTGAADQQDRVLQLRTELAQATTEKQRQGFRRRST
ncbi:hypothetical protein ACPA9J_27635 [Pseudomonas aeruginosa]